MAGSSGCNDFSEHPDRLPTTDGLPPHPFPPSDRPWPNPRPQQKHSKLYTEQPPKPARPPIEPLAACPIGVLAFRRPRCCRRYDTSRPPTRSRRRTAWSSPVCLSPKSVTGFLTLEQNESKAEGEAPKAEGGRRKAERRKAEGGRRKAEGKAGSAVPRPASLTPHPVVTDRDAAQRLAGSIAELLSELLDTRRVLWQREAELAAGVPGSAPRGRKAPGRPFGSRIAGGAEAVGGDAIALYLLDEATTELKLRCSWGLPFDRLAAPARPLQGAVADLEALLGHAVVLDDDRRDADVEHARRLPRRRVRAGLDAHHAAGHALGLLQRTTRFQRPRDEHPGGRRRPAGLGPGTRDAVACGHRGAKLKSKWLRPSGCNGTNCRRSRRCWTAGTWPAGRPRPRASAGRFTIGSACPTVCWPWRLARRPSKGSPAQ